MDAHATILIGHYDLSILIAIFAAYAALDLAGRMTAAQGRGSPRFIWLGGRALAMGMGIWSIHYVGMEVFSLPMAMQ